MIIVVKFKELKKFCKLQNHTHTKRLKWTYLLTSSIDEHRHNYRTKYKRNFVHPDLRAHILENNPQGTLGGYDEKQNGRQVCLCPYQTLLSHRSLYNDLGSSLLEHGLAQGQIVQRDMIWPEYQCNVGHPPVYHTRSCNKSPIIIMTSLIW